MRDTAWYMATFDVARPQRVLTGLGPQELSPSGGLREQWDVMIRPPRGVEENQRAHRTGGDGSDEEPELVRALDGPLRLGAPRWARPGDGRARPRRRHQAGRRHLAALLTLGAFLTAVVGRIAVVALVDAATVSRRDQRHHVLPGMDFYLAFGLTGTLLLVTVVRELRLPARADDGDVADEAALTTTRRSPPCPTTSRPRALARTEQGV